MRGQDGGDDPSVKGLRIVWGKGEGRRRRKTSKGWKLSQMRASYSNLDLQLQPGISRGSLTIDTSAVWYLVLKLEGFSFDSWFFVVIYVLLCGMPTALGA